MFAAKIAQPITKNTIKKNEGKKTPLLPTYFSYDKKPLYTNAF